MDDQFMICFYPKEWKVGRKCGEKCIEFLSDSTCNDRSPIDQDKFDIWFDEKSEHYCISVSMVSLRNYCIDNNIDYYEYRNHISSWADGFVNAYGCIAPKERGK